MDGSIRRLASGGRQLRVWILKALEAHIYAEVLPLGSGAAEVVAPLGEGP